MRSRRGLRLAALPLLGLLAVDPASAQTSASYKLSETTVDDGGDPRNAAILTAAHFHIGLDSVGDTVVRAALTSASFRIDAGFVGRYPPPGEVAGFAFSNKTTLGWNPERSVGKYEVYRGQLSSLPGTYGACFAAGLTVETVAAGSNPAPGQGYFYVVTARNRLGEEGPKGYRSDGTVEGNPSPCH